MNLDDIIKCWQTGSMTAMVSSIIKNESDVLFDYLKELRGYLPKYAGNKRIRYLNDGYVLNFKLAQNGYNSATDEDIIKIIKYELLKRNKVKFFLYKKLVNCYRVFIKFIFGIKTKTHKDDIVGLLYKRSGFGIVPILSSLIKKICSCISKNWYKIVMALFGFVTVIAIVYNTFLKGKM